ncbi:MAG: LysR family transcriptional regulator [Salinarimonas sp.]
MAEEIQDRARSANGANPLDSKRLDQFLAVVDEGSFRGAARVLNVAQPALSRNVRALETALDVSLLERSRSGVVPTQAGAALAEGARRLRKDAVDLAVRTVLADKGDVGVLRIAYTDFAIAGALPAIVKQLRSRLPGISLQFVPLFTSEQIDALRLGQIDVGFLTGPLRNPELDARVVQTDRLVVIAPDSHYLASRSSVSIEALRDEDFVFGEARAWAHFLAHITKLCFGHGFLPRTVQEARDSSAILGLVAAGIGVTINIRRNFVNQANGCVCLEIENEPYEIQTLMVRSRADNSPVVKKLFSAI